MGCAEPCDLLGYVKGFKCSYISRNASSQDVNMASLYFEDCFPLLAIYSVLRPSRVILTLTSLIVCLEDALILCRSVAWNRGIQRYCGRSHPVKHRGIHHGSRGRFCRNLYFQTRTLSLRNELHRNFRPVLSCTDSAKQKPSTRFYPPLSRGSGRWTCCLYKIQLTFALSSKSFVTCNGLFL